MTDTQAQADIASTLPEVSYARRVITEAEELGDIVEEAAGDAAKDVGWKHYKGKVVEDGSIKCGRCDAKKVYAGDCLYTGEHVMCAECGGDPAHNNYTNRESYYACLGCGHVSHYPPSVPTGAKS